MNSKNLKASNKKNADKSKSNSIISSKNTSDNVNDYVSGDAFPSSASHKFNKNTQNKEEN